MEHIGQCRECGTSWTGPENLPCPTPELHVSPAQLREKVERLSAAYDEVNADLRAAYASLNNQRDRLDAALRRIEQLERDVARLQAQQTSWRGVNRYEAPIDKEDV